MFSGIVEEIGLVISADHRPELSTLWIQSQICLQDIKKGDSLSVNGVCLTVCDFTTHQFMCQAIPETIRLTNLGLLGEGAQVNLERSILPTTRIGGHYVQGHVDGATSISRLEQEGDSLKIWFKRPPFYEDCFLKKGYITLDGMSLTLVDVTPTEMSVCFIPHTQAVTIVSTYQLGTQVNVEVDSVIKTIVTVMNQRRIGEDNLDVKLDKIETALSTLKKGGMVVVVDDENRENEGDLVCAASLVTPEQVNFMAEHGRGLICVALPPEQIERLQLAPMSSESTDGFGTAFTVSIDAKEGITTGISAADRALTIRLAVDPKTSPEQVCVPGHIFPLEARGGGVFRRRGHTEASVDLTRLAGLVPGGVICEILCEDGTMMRLPDLRRFADKHNLPLISIQDLFQYRLDSEIEVMTQTTLPTRLATFNQRIYHDSNGMAHVLLWLGNLKKPNFPLVRIHSECMTGDVFGSLRCDCGPQLRESMNLITQEKAGIIIYLRQEGRGIGLTEKIKAYALQDEGLDTVEANLALGHEPDLRTYEVAVKMLQDLAVPAVRLLTNNPQKIDFLEENHIEVERVSLHVGMSPYNVRYRQVKTEKMGHIFHNISPNNKD